VLPGADHNLQLPGGPLPDGGFRWPGLAPGVDTCF
jgi:hypothetical protein